MFTNPRKIKVIEVDLDSEVPQADGQFSRSEVPPDSYVDDSYIGLSSFEHFTEEIHNVIKSAERGTVFSRRRPGDSSLFRCYEVRECPDRKCVAFQAVTARCWYLAGERCGCRKAFNLQSCLDCSVFQHSTPDPLARIRESVYYLIGMINRKQEDKEKYLVEIMKVNKDLKALKGEAAPDARTSRFKGDREKDLAFQKRLTEELGSAYLQLQTVSAELERSNQRLEDKVSSRTAELKEKSDLLENNNAELEKAMVKAREAEQLKSDFIANISHELRTPLNSIIGFSKLLLNRVDGEITEGQEVDLKAIHRSGQHLLTIINTILDLAKIESGKLDFTPEPIDVREVIEELEHTFSPLLEEKKLKFRSRIGSEVKEIRADRMKLKQILMHLLSNAVNFTDQGSVTIEAKSDKKNITINITDTGIGIAPENIPKIFDRFSQIDVSYAKKAGGTGLGLNIARRYVDLHQGELLVKSRIGVGSTFTVKIPMALEETRV